MSNQNSGFSAWGVGLALLFVFAMLLQLFSPGNTAPSTSYTPDRNSAEHRYVTERFRQEGFSSSDSKTAADAVLKFHEAQKNR
ncbi:hypothetical protein EBZ39_00365 [bacterium]|nr:hypothetical protein [bacterium]